MGDYARAVAQLWLAQSEIHRLRGEHEEALQEAENLIRYGLLSGECPDSMIHAAMSGRTKMVVGIWNNRFTHVPMSAVISRRKQLEPFGPEWLAVLESTGQPASMKAEG